MILSCVSLFAQKVKTVSAEYTYFAPETMSVEEAKRTALDRAKIQAIADEFGTIVSQTTTTVISSNNGNSDSQFFAIGGSDVKGEWIETIGEPVFEINFQDHLLIVKCKVKGKAREISRAVIDVVAKPLKNGTDLRFEAYDFRDGDDLYLYFLSPVDGYLSVYLLDESNQTVYNILPYRRQSETAVNVKANKEYIFFSKKHADKTERNLIDEYTLTAESVREYNTLYILFSPDEIGKQIGFGSSSEDKPDNISFKDFRQWLGKALSRDKNLQPIKFSITIDN